MWWSASNNFSRVTTTSSEDSAHFCRRTTRVCSYLVCKKLFLYVFRVQMRACVLSRLHVCPSVHWTKGSHAGSRACSLLVHAIILMLSQILGVIYLHCHVCTCMNGCDCVFRSIARKPSMCTHSCINSHEKPSTTLPCITKETMHAYRKNTYIRTLSQEL